MSEIRSIEVKFGGCSCGAVRFKVEGELGHASICHCRMCQKAYGNFYAPLVSVRGAKFTWTKAEPKHFQSSNLVARGFCSDCGTPLTYEAPDGMAVSIAAFDKPAEIIPIIQFGIEAKLPYVDHLHQLPGSTTMDDIEAAPFLDKLISYQHPDRED